MSEKLIFDIGFHKGEDSKYYISKGYKVVAVEANPILVDAGRSQFKKEIEQKNLILINVGIADQTGSLPFYVNKDQSEWSSFDKESATRHNSTYEVLNISTIKTTELFEKYGVPHYLKVDIEGFDIYCIKELGEAKPKYISCEAVGVELLDILYSKGYTKFKMINQGNGFKQIDLIKEAKWWYPKFIVIRNGLNKWFGHILPFKYKFASSGPFGEDTHGKWLDYDTVKKQYTAFLNSGTPLNPISWFDFHATY